MTGNGGVVVFCNLIEQSSGRATRMDIEDLQSQDASVSTDPPLYVNIIVTMTVTPSSDRLAGESVLQEGRKVQELVVASHDSQEHHDLLVMLLIKNNYLFFILILMCVAVIINIFFNLYRANKQH